MDGLQEKEQPQAATDACVARMNQVCFAWKKGAPKVLSALSLKVTRGERLFIGGASGSGKTTLLGLFAGVLVPQSGTVEMLDRRVDSMSAAARDQFRADHMGYIHQMFNLIPYLSVVENVTLPCRFSRNRVGRLKESPESDARRLLQALGLKDEALLKRAVTELSVGQQQRVAAARALIGAPEIVIADEPTSALDAANREAFIELLFEECAASGASLIFVSHDTSLGAMFDRSVQLEGGAPC